MKYKKRKLLYVSVMLCLTVLCSCSQKEYGTEKNPAGVGQVMYYDGTEALKEKNRFKAEIVLEDVVRGETAQDIFAAAAGMRTTMRRWNSAMRKNLWWPDLHLPSRMCRKILQ